VENKEEKMLHLHNPNFYLYLAFLSSSVHILSFYSRFIRNSNFRQITFPRQKACSESRCKGLSRVCRFNCIKNKIIG